jgi:hypothetical protein
MTTKKARRKASPDPDRDRMLSEYDFSKATRGVTAARYAAGTNVVVNRPGFAAALPNLSCGERGVAGTPDHRKAGKFRKPKGAFGLRELFQSNRVVQPRRSTKPRPDVEMIQEFRHVTRRELQRAADAELGSEAVDFRAASESFGTARKLTGRSATYSGIPDLLPRCAIPLPDVAERLPAGTTPPSNTTCARRIVRHGRVCALAGCGAVMRTSVQRWPSHCHKFSSSPELPAPPYDARSLE